MRLIEAGRDPVRQQWEGGRKGPYQLVLLKKITDLPSGLVVKNLPANAADTGSIPGLRGSPMPWSSEACVPQQLKPALELMLHNKRSHHNTKPAHHSKE